MIMEFNSLQDMKEFADFISNELKKNNEENLSLEVSGFSYNSYTTPSEYWGEFRILLKKLLEETTTALNKETKQNILKAIEAINIAFDNA